MRKQNVKSSRLDKLEYRFMRATESFILAILTVSIGISAIIGILRLLKHLMN